ncbi:MAG TPA: transporter substrate-binding domain-containing protein [Chthoniobacterales bacterium]|jgi:ABC-type amino acid transport substrate-binding protein|nr:transporter substrate-binding domain-containing protein [Chthoniobacterales bacterium]
MRILVLFSLIAFSLIGSAVAQQKVHVITRNIEPFSFEKDSRRAGFAMELWDNVARELKLDYDVAVTDSAKKMVTAVQDKTADVGVGALSITAEREKVIDFSQPFYESGLQILVSKKPAGLTDIIWTILQGFFTWQLLAGTAVAILIMFIISHLVWMYEHRVNEEMWPRSYLAGMGESFWWTLSIFLVGGADNKGPVGMGGRIVATIWMFASVIAVSLLTASLSALLTVNSLSSDISKPSDLPGKAVATLGGSTAEAWLTQLGASSGEKVNVKIYPDVAACLAALKNGQVKAVVYDAPILKYWVNKLGPDDYELVGSMFERNNYGFALQQDSQLRERINQVLLDLNESGVTDRLKKDWFGEEQ